MLASGVPVTAPVDLSKLSWWALTALRTASWTTDTRKAEIDLLLPLAYERDGVAKEGRISHKKRNPKRM